MSHWQAVRNLHLFQMETEASSICGDLYCYQMDVLFHRFCLQTRSTANIPPFFYTSNKVISCYLLVRNCLWNNYRELLFVGVWHTIHLENKAGGVLVKIVLNKPARMQTLYAVFTSYSYFAVDLTFLTCLLTCFPLHTEPFSSFTPYFSNRVHNEVN